MNATLKQWLHQRQTANVLSLCVVSLLLNSSVGARPAWGGPTADNVLVLYNTDDGPTGDGFQIASYYQQARPGVNLAGISLSEVEVGQLRGNPDSETISASDYLSEIRPQVLEHIQRVEAERGVSIEVIVTTKGLPLRIDAGPGPDNPGFNRSQFSSLESELTRIDTIDTIEQLEDQTFLSGFPTAPSTLVLPGGVEVEVPGDTNLASNPIYNSSGPFVREGSDPERAGIRLTSRLDGYSVETVRQSIDRAQRAFIVPGDQFIVADDDPGPVLVDQIVDTPQGPGPGLINVVQERFPEIVGEIPTDLLLFEGTNAAVTVAERLGDERRVIGFVSHGANDGPGGFGPNYLGEFDENGDFQPGEVDFEFADGAIFLTHESFNAESFDPSSTQGQGQVADFLELGGTAGLGHVAEPLNGPDNVTNEDILYERLLPPGWLEGSSGALELASGASGLTFVEAAWQATRQLSTVNTVVGDPLLRFRIWLPGDFNLDGVVNEDDLVILEENFLQAGDYTLGDTNADGVIDQADLAVVQNNLLRTVDAPELTPSAAAVNAAISNTIAAIDDPDSPLLEFLVIPEPVSLTTLLIAVAMGTLVLGRRRY